MKKNEEKGYVYLLGDWEKEGIYKIGVTKGTIDRRIKKLQTGNAGEIYLCNYYHTEHPFYIEKILHQRLLPKRISGEWYNLEPDEVFKFKDLCDDIERMAESLIDNPFFPKKLK